MHKWIYIKLLDKEHRNQIIRAEGSFQQLYKDGEWIRTAAMLDYYCDGAPYHDMYEYITEAEAIKIIGKKAIEMPAQTKARG